MASPEPVGDPVRLDRLDRDEMFDVVRLLKPAITEAEFDAMWAENMELKRRRALS